MARMKFIATPLVHRVQRLRHRLQAEHYVPGAEPAPRRDLKRGRNGERSFGACMHAPSALHGGVPSIASTSRQGSSCTTDI